MHINRKHPNLIFFNSVRFFYFEKTNFNKTSRLIWIRITTLKTVSKTWYFVMKKNIFTLIYGSFWIFQVDLALYVWKILYFTSHFTLKHSYTHYLKGKFSVFVSKCNEYFFLYHGLKIRGNISSSTYIWSFILFKRKCCYKLTAWYKIKKLVPQDILFNYIIFIFILSRFHFILIRPSSISGGFSFLCSIFFLTCC